MAGSPDRLLRDFHDTLLPSENSYPVSARRLFGVEIDLEERERSGSGLFSWQQLSDGLSARLSVEEGR